MPVEEDDAIGKKKVKNKKLAKTARRRLKIFQPPTDVDNCVCWQPNAGNANEGNQPEQPNDNPPRFHVSTGNDICGRRRELGAPYQVRLIQKRS